MASEIKVNKISPESGTTLTLGDNGDTINFGTGVLPNFENLTVTGDLTVDTNSLKVDSTNNFVGIGTASPSVALDVVGAITATGNITGTLATASQPNITSVGTLTGFTSTGIDDNATSTAITIDSSQNVDVAGLLTSDGLTMNTGANTTYTLEFGANRTSDNQALGIIRGSWDGTVVSQINLSAGNDTTNKDNGQIFFRTSEAGSTANRLQIAENGDISFYEDTGTTPKLFWDASTERLGIGTSSPDLPLDIEIDVGSSGTVARISNSNSTYAQDIDFKFNSSKDVILDTASGSGAIVLEPGSRGVIINEEGSDKDFRVESNNNGNMLFVDGGNDAVGIGTSTPGTRLSFGNYIPSNGQTIHTYQSGNTVSGLGIVSGVHRMFTNAGSSISFGHVSTSDGSTYSEAMRIDSSGNVGIGTSSPSNLLHLTGPQNGTALQIANTVDTDGIRINAGVSGLANNALQFLNNSGDSLLIIDGTNKSTIIGNIGYTGYRASFGDFEVKNLDGNGNPGGTLVLSNTDGSITSSQILGNLTFASYDQSGASTTGGVASIKAYANETYSSTSGAYLSFFTHPASANNGTVDGNMVENMRITENGTIQISAVPTLSLSFLTDSNTGIARPSSDTFAINTGGSERMRIDSSGNVLVGTTSSQSGASSGNGGQFIASPTGGLATSFARNSATVNILNRIGTDGTIISFRKDGAGVGSIGVVNTNNLFIQGDSTNSGLQCGTNTILPVQSGANASNTIDMGDGSNLWKDLYLGGGVYLGGTGTANKLDDYEEGTWTPTIQASGNHYSSVTYITQNGRYTKIGRQVFANFRVYISAVTIGSATGNINIEGLPFSVANVDSTNQASYISYVSDVNFNLSSFGTINIGLNAFYNQNKGGLTRSKNSGTADGLPNSAIGQATDIVGTFIYFVD